MGEILTTIITILTVVGFISAQTVMMIRGQERIRKESKEEFKEVRAEFKEVRTEIKEVRGDIAAVDKRLSHTDGLVEGLSRALLSTQAPAQTQAQALPQTQAQA